MALSKEELLALVNEDFEDTLEVFGEVDLGSSIHTLRAGDLCSIGSVRISEDVSVEGAVDLRPADARIRLTEFAVRSQYKGGKVQALALAESEGVEPVKQTVAEMTITHPGARLGFVIDDEFLPHPFYTDPRTAVMARRAGSTFGQRFNVMMDVLGTDDTSDASTLYKVLRSFDWSTPTYQGNQAEDPASEMIWHLAPTIPDGLSPTQSAIERANRGIELVSYTFSDTLREDGFGATVGFANFIEAYVANLTEASGLLAQAVTREEQRQAMRFSYSWTGCKAGDDGTPRRYPERASVGEIVVSVQTGAGRFTTMPFSFGTTTTVSE